VYDTSDFELKNLIIVGIKANTKAIYSTRKLFFTYTIIGTEAKTLTLKIPKLK